LKTTDGGEKWNFQSSGITANLYSVHFADSNTGWIVGELSTLLKTTNGGINWNYQTIGTGNRFWHSVYFTGNDTGWVVGNAGIMKTIDGGANWVSQYGGQYSLYSVYFIDSNTGWVVGEDLTIRKTSNGGANWIGQSGSLFANSLESVHFADSNTGWAVGGWQGGIILNTTDGGENWNSQTVSPSPFDYLSGVYFTDSNTGWAVGGTILHTTNGGVTFVEEEELDEIPITYSLTQNFPNPFNPSTKIKYSVPELNYVTIKVYDVLGREVITLVNEEKSAGNYKIEFSAKGGAIDLSSGIYFYRIKAGDFIETKKMTLIK
jgi:photosystem II stability/assembly factor-like uncharacterized protein